MTRRYVPGPGTVSAIILLAALLAGTAAAAPGLSVDMEISADAVSGTDLDATWHDLNVLSIAHTRVGDTLWYRITVTNSGEVPLGSVVVIDSDTGDGPTDPAPLDPGESVTHSASSVAEPGTHAFTAVAYDTRTGLFDSVTATYSAWTTSLAIEASVSIDGGTTWMTADTVAGAPVFPAGVDPVVRFLVTNTGTLGLRDVTVTDTVNDISHLPPRDLSPGESTAFCVTVPWKPGPHVNTATATGTPLHGLPAVTATGRAHWSGAHPVMNARYVTFPPGAYAGEGGAGTLLAACFPVAFPDGLQVGVIDGGNGYRWNPTGIGLIGLKAFLATSGPSGKITCDAYDPATALYGGGTLATETAALGITLRLDELGLLGTAGDFGDIVYSPKDPFIAGEMYYPYMGMTVTQIFEASSTALAGLTPEDPYYDALATLVGRLNTAYDGGAASNWTETHLIPPVMV